jgi:hypothetical protein
MTKVYILQTDNRPIGGYLILTQNVNKKISDYLGYKYVYIPMNSNAHPTMHPATQKIYIVNEFLQQTDGDILVFLDSDAWVQNANYLKDIINNLISDENKQGAFSRDPYIVGQTFINSGSFILRVNNFTKNMYSEIIQNVQNDPSHHKSWPYDQYYISNYVFNNKKSFNIFTPPILNTPQGEVLRHNWYKGPQMYEDLKTILQNPLPAISENTFEFENNYDTELFPNISTEGEMYKGTNNEPPSPPPPNNYNNWLQQHLLNRSRR